MLYSALAKEAAASATSAPSHTNYTHQRLALGKDVVGRRIGALAKAVCASPVFWYAKYERCIINAPVGQGMMVSECCVCVFVVSPEAAHVHRAVNKRKCRGAASLGLLG